MVKRRNHQSADLNFQGQHAGETFQFYYYQHWMRLVWPTTKMLIKTVLVFLIGYIILVRFQISDPFTRRATLAILSLFFLLAHFELLSRLYRHFLRVVVVTDRKVHKIKKFLLTINDHQSIDLWMLQDIFKRQHSFIQNILGFGTIILEAQETQLRLHFIPRIDDYYERIMYLREQARELLTYGSMRSGAEEKKNLRSFESPFSEHMRRISASA